MDPLFGFVDDITEGDHHPQNQQQTGGAGGETITFTSCEQLQQSLQLQQQGQGHNNLEFGNLALNDQMIQVVSTNPNNPNSGKQVIIVSLADLLREGQQVQNQGVANHNGGGDMGPGGEGGNQESMEMDAGFSGDSSSGEDSSGVEAGVENGMENGVEEEDEECDPYLAISPEAVSAVAQSVGVDLSEDVASELGCIVMNKLRHAILMAMQFSQNENSEGMVVEHFAKAEEQMNSPSLGHESAFREISFKYAGGVTILDDGPEIDLYASIRQTNMSEIQIEEVEPALNVHHLRTHDCNSERNNNSSNFQLYDEPVPVVEYCERKKTEDGNEPSAAATDLANSNSLEHSSTSGNTNGPTRAEDDETVESMADEMLGTSTAQDGSDPSSGQQNAESTPNLSTSFDSNASDEVAPEWASYLELLVEQVLSHNYKTECNYKSSSNLQIILNDIRHNGAHPIFHVVCDSFRDYLRDTTLTQSSLMNIIAVLDALISSQCSPTSTQMTDAASVLIEIIILPPPCELHRVLVNVFMKILKHCNELLTWTCTYVTEMLKGISEIQIDQLHDSHKSTMHGALCLTNGLEELKIQVAQEFGWHTSVLNLSSNHSRVFEGGAYNPTRHDSFLEEEILRFYHNFVKNYNSLVVPSELSVIRETIMSLYGERFTVPIVFDGPISVKQNVSSKSSKNPRCVFRKFMYKDKEIVVPCRRNIRNS